MTSWSETPMPREHRVPRRRRGDAVPHAWLRAYHYMVARDDGRVGPATTDESRAIHERIMQAWMES